MGTNGTDDVVNTQDKTPVETVKATLVGPVVEITVANPTPQTIAELRRLPGRRFVAGRNLVPVGAGEMVSAFLARCGAAIPAGLPQLSSLSDKVSLDVMITEDELVLFFPVAPTPNQIERLSACVVGISHNTATDTWRVARSPQSAIGLARFVHETAAVVVGDLAEVMRELDQKALSQVAASRSVSSELKLDGFGRTLRPFQRAGVAYLVERQRAILGDDMGLGKTTQALAAVHHGGFWPLIVVCQSSMKLTWAKEAAICLPGRSIAVVNGTKRAPIRVNRSQSKPDVTIVNYELLESRCADLEALEAKAVILDESQAFKSAGALRTKAAHRLTKRVITLNGAVYALSGTPALNAPAELIEQLRLIGRLEDFGGWRHFVERYCNGRRVTTWDPEARAERDYWQVQGAANLVELHERLRATCFIRRTKADVMVDLPPVELAEFVLDGLDPEAMAAYFKAERDLVAYLYDRAQSAGMDPLAKLESALVAETLVQRTVLRQLVGQAKIPAVVRWLEEFLSSTEEKVLVFAWHREVTTKLAEKVGAPLMIGGMRPAQIENAINAFQIDPTVRVLVANIGVGGQGHSLTAASHIAFAEEPWTPAAIAQCISRAYGRLSDIHGVTAYHLVAAGTIDSDILDLVARKANVTTAIVDGKDVRDVETSEAVAVGVLRRMAARHREVATHLPKPKERLGTVGGRS
jgi:SWI/SNF-related matrix-associated actin-dependent regulator 1 of chromatin subfamily A